MKVIHLSVSCRGGAGIAASRSVDALCRRGIDAALWSMERGPSGGEMRSAAVSRWRARLENLPLRFYPAKRLFSAWSNNLVPSRLAARINEQKPDIVHLHWIGGGFMHPAEIAQIEAPVVWTLHDAWGFTGGCHYPEACRRFAAACGKCPQLGSGRLHDLSWINLRSKRRWLARVSAVVSPSEWLASLARSVGGVCAERLHVIPNGLDGDTYFPGDREQARRELELAEDAIVLVAGAHDLGEVRKGVHLLREGLAILSRERPAKYCLLLFGANGDRDRESDWPCPTRWVGAIEEAAHFVRIFGAADACVLPSLQDNLPNIAVEALACGCPVIGYDSGGLGEIIEPMRTGLLASELSATGLAKALGAWFESTHIQHARLAARKRFESRFSLVEHGQQLESLYSAL